MTYCFVQAWIRHFEQYIILQNNVFPLIFFEWLRSLHNFSCVFQMFTLMTQFLTTCNYNACNRQFSKLYNMFSQSPWHVEKSHCLNRLSIVFPKTFLSLYYWLIWYKRFSLYHQHSRSLLTGNCKIHFIVVRVILTTKLYVAVLISLVVRSCFDVLLYGLVSYGGWQQNAKRNRLYLLVEENRIFLGCNKLSY